MAENLKVLEISLYDEDNEVIAEYSRSFVPWKLLKQAVRISKTVNQNDIKEDDMDLLANLVVEAFGNKFSVEDLDKHAGIEEMVAVLNTILSKARLSMPANPTQPQG